MIFSGKLHPYQVEDVEFLLQRKNALLAYGQGTGKTVMTIAAIEEAFDRELITEPGLIVCPASLKDQWEQAILKWTGGYEDMTPSGLLRWCSAPETSEVLVIPSGTTPAKRYEAYAEAMDWNKWGGADYIVLSYEQVVNDWSYVRKLPRGFVVLDEATMIKGFSSKRSKRVKRLSSDFRIALTGTPIENGKLEEMFSIMQWVDESVFGPWTVFDPTFIKRDGFGNVKYYRNVPLFIEDLKQAMRRRTRKDADVKPFFPEVDDDKPPIEVHLDKKTAAVYKHIAGQLADDLREVVYGDFDIGSLYGFGGNDGDGLTGRIAQKRMALQMLIDHPHLIRISAKKFDAYMNGAAPGGSMYCSELVKSGMLDPLRGVSPKLQAALEWIQWVLDIDPRNKVVVFSTYVGMLEAFEVNLDCKSVQFHGGMSAKQKAFAMGTFKQDPECRVFLSSDAGGYGIDLPEANYLLNYSLPDKWGTSDQRETRIIRASSTFDTVQIRRITVAGSIDVLKYHKLSMKGKVAAAYLEGIGYDDRGKLNNDVTGLLHWLTHAGELAVI